MINRTDRRRVSTYLILIADLIEANAAQDERARLTRLLKQVELGILELCE